MYKKILLIVFSVILCCGISIKAQTVDEIIDKHYEAIGGKENWEALKTMKTTGSMVMGPGMSLDLTIMLKRPDKTLLTIEFQGQKLIQAYNVDHGWTINPFEGSNEPKKMKDEEAKDIKEMADMGGKMMNYKSKGYSAELIGKEELDGTGVYHITLTSSDGDVTHYYMDTENYMILKSAGIKKKKDKEMESETFFSNYKKVDGLIIPFSMEQKLSENPMGTQKILLTKVEFNVDIDDEVFKMPTK